jgi:hypothetical protein
MRRASSSSCSGLGRPAVQPSPASWRRVRRLSWVPSGSRGDEVAGWYELRAESVAAF